MVKRTANASNQEPEQAKFDLPSEKEHLLQVVDIYTQDDEMGAKLKLDEDTVSVSLEVVGGDEAGRTLLNRLNLNETSKGFFATRMFLKAIGEPYKDSIEIDTDRWCGRQLYATVKHNGKYANIDQYNFDKKIEQQYKPPVNSNPSGVTDPKDIAWEE